MVHRPKKVENHWINVKEGSNEWTVCFLLQYYMPHMAGRRGLV